MAKLNADHNISEPIQNAHDLLLSGKIDLYCHSDAICAADYVDLCEGDKLTISPKTDRDGDMVWTMRLTQPK